MKPTFFSAFEDGACFGSQMVVFKDEEFYEIPDISIFDDTFSSFVVYFHTLQPNLDIFGISLMRKLVLCWPSKCTCVTCNCVMYR